MVRRGRERGEREEREREKKRKRRERVSEVERIDQAMSKRKYYQENVYSHTLTIWRSQMYMTSSIKIIEPIKI